ncbi:glypican-1-like isoform X2 [Planococcus citri]|uniref:glypican-1-like isoform X2 n=1 Tax=Planococcus citri TaxID=170843 RepID=UPI0031F97CFF
MNAIYLSFFCVFWCCVQTLPTDVFSNLTTCSYVIQIFETKNISNRIPNQPIDGKSLSICKSDKSCCTSEMESNLMNLVKKDYQSLLQQNAQSVQGILASTAIHFTEYIHRMLLKSENKTKEVLRDVLGTSTAKIEESVKTYFDELYNYIANKNEGENTYFKSSQNQYVKSTEQKFAQLTSSFFTRLFPSLYPLIVDEYGGADRELDSEYEKCLQKNIGDINPFSELTKSLEKDTSKTFGATEILIDALNFGSQMLNFSNLLVLSESSHNIHQCHEALLRMSYCSRCNGLPSTVKPCAGYCLNVMRGCLAQQAGELDSAWSSFYEAVDRLMSVVNRGQSLVCLEDLLRSLDARIAEPVQHFKLENGSVHSKVKFTCGQVRWSSNRISENRSSKLPESRPNWKLDEEDSNFRSTLLSSKIRQFQESVPRSRGFYANLAETLCADDSFAEKRETALCWNGQRVAEYAKTVLPIQITSQKYNPEIPWQSPPSTDTRITEMVEKLRHTTQLVLSQAQTNPEAESLSTNEDGSGSGSNPMSPDDQLTSDDEDSERDWSEQGSGSGDSPIPMTEPPGGIVPHGANNNVRKLPEPADVTPTETTTRKPNSAKTWTSNIILVMTICTVSRLIS